MDAKSRANFINSVASGQKIPCSKCNVLNEADSKFCEACGAPLEARKESNDVAFAPLTQAATETQEDATKAPAKVAETYVDDKNVFAEGLPEWNIEPPQVMVRRKRK